MKRLVPKFNVNFGEQISAKLSERVSFDFSEENCVEFSEQIGGRSTEIIRVEIRGAIVRPLPFPSLLCERRMPAF